MFRQGLTSITHWRRFRVGSERGCSPRTLFELCGSIPYGATVPETGTHTNSPCGTVWNVRHSVTVETSVQIRSGALTSPTSSSEMLVGEFRRIARYGLLGRFAKPCGALRIVRVRIPCPPLWPDPVLVSGGRLWICMSAVRFRSATSDSPDAIPGHSPANHLPV